MLESSCLRLMPWSQTRDLAGESAWRREITDAEGLRLGAIRLTGTPGTSWFFWQRSARLQVVETDDNSDLFELRQSWALFNVWELSDAEDTHVGTIYARTLISSLGDCLAYVDKSDPDDVRIFDPAGLEIAEIRTTHEGEFKGKVELTFNPPVTANPFLRMMLLACAIALHPAPEPH